MSKIGCAFFGMSFCHLKEKEQEKNPQWANTFVLFLLET